jgi:hypothetical protein
VAKLVGAQWMPLGDPETFGPIRCLLAYGDSLVAGGDLYRAGGTPVRGVAVWDGTAWAALGAGLEGAVQCLSVYGGQLIAGGDFERSGDVACNGLARWDGSSWHDMGLGRRTGQVRSLAVYGGELYVGGTALDVPAVAAEPQALVRWNGIDWSGVSHGLADGETVTVGCGIGGGADWTKPASVMSLVEFEGNLILGGQFSSAWNGGDELAVRGIVAWDGARFARVGGASMLPTLEGVCNVLALGVEQGRLCVGGCFAQVQLEGGSPVPTTDFAVWDGSSWIDPDVLGFNDCAIHVSSLVGYNGSVVIGCRARGVASGQTVNYLSRWAPGCTGIESTADGVPARTTLAAAYPNPANPRLRLTFQLAAAGSVSLAIYNSAGRRIQLLADAWYPTGSHGTEWDGRDEHGIQVASGVYEIVLATRSGSVSRKVALVR